MTITAILDKLVQHKLDVPIIVDVTHEDIARGVKLSTIACPIALAACRLFPDDRVIADPRYLRTRFRAYPLPYEARAFITRFDAQLPVSAFRFELQWYAELLMCLSRT